MVLFIHIFFLFTAIDRLLKVEKVIKIQCFTINLPFDVNFYAEPMPSLIYYGMEHMPIYIHLLASIFVENSMIPKKNRRIFGI